MAESGKSKVGRNAELGFLYKKLSLIRANVISEIALVPEYMDALKSCTSPLNDRVVYEIIRATYKRMLLENKGYRTARDVMNKVSKDVTGDSTTWQAD